jgi:hypothetical protein
MWNIAENCSGMKWSAIYILPNNNSCIEIISLLSEIGGVRELFAHSIFSNRPNPGMTILRMVCLSTVKYTQFWIFWKCSFPSEMGLINISRLTTTMIMTLLMMISKKCRPISICQTYSYLKAFINKMSFMFVFALQNPILKRVLLNSVHVTRIMIGRFLAVYYRVIQASIQRLPDRYHHRIDQWEIYLLFRLFSSNGLSHQAIATRDLECLRVHRHKF